VHLTARTLFAMGRDGGIPRAFAATTPRFRSPYVGIAVSVVLTLILGAWLGRHYGVGTYFALMATTASLGILIVYALVAIAGMVFFWNARHRPPCVSADQLGEAFGVAKSTMGSKARRVRDLLRMGYFSPEFQRADVAERNPLRWFIELNGLVVDSRDVPLEIQVEAFQRGLIPYIPAVGPDGMAVRGGAPAAGTATAAAPSEAAVVLEHCSELKRRLAEFARSRRFSRELDQAVSQGMGGTATGESESL
jgi:hypothetical protein